MLAIPIAWRRSIRSTRAPENRANRNQGSVEAKSIAAILAGSRVIVAAINGSAVSLTPSPRLEMADATHNFR
jgi:hypothetical protein